MEQLCEVRVGMLLFNMCALCWPRGRAPGAPPDNLRHGAKAADGGNKLGALDRVRQPARVHNPRRRHKLCRCGAMCGCVEEW